MNRDFVGLLTQRLLKQKQYQTLLRLTRVCKDFYRWIKSTPDNFNVIVRPNLRLGLNFLAGKYLTRMNVLGDGLCYEKGTEFRYIRGQLSGECSFSIPGIRGTYKNGLPEGEFLYCPNGQTQGRFYYENGLLQGQQYPDLYAKHPKIWCYDKGVRVGIVNVKRRFPGKKAAAKLGSLVKTPAGWSMDTPKLTADHERRRTKSGDKHYTNYFRGNSDQLIRLYRGEQVKKWL